MGLLAGQWVWGKEGVGENPSPTRVPVLWAGGRGRTAACFSRGPRWVSGCVKPWTPALMGWTEGTLKSLGLTEARENRFSVLDIPDATVCHRRAENKVGSPGVAQSALELKRGEGRERGGAGWFPSRQKSLVWSVAGVQEGLLGRS